MIDKYRLEDLRRESGEKGELARWVIQLQVELDRERRKGVDSAELQERSKADSNSHPAHCPLYTASPAPVVPDRFMFEIWWESENGTPLDSWDSLRTTDGYCDDGIDGQFDAWNACRAAMLNGGKS